MVGFNELDKVLKMLFWLACVGVLALAGLAGWVVIYVAMRVFS